MDGLGQATVEDEFDVDMLMTGVFGWVGMVQSQQGMYKLGAQPICTCGPG